MMNRQFIEMADFKEPLMDFLLNLGDPIGERIATNNLVDISNNKVRNTIMSK